VYQQLAASFPDRVFPIYESVDLTKPQSELGNAVLVMAGMMHHIPLALRPNVLKTLSATNSHMMMFEPLRRTALSMFLAALAIVPAWLLPLTFLARPGRARRILWCWLVPIVPLMFAWDGVISCCRQWTAQEWLSALGHDQCQDARDVEIDRGLNSLKINWSGRLSS
jgi:hypothetical protein